MAVNFAHKVLIQSYKFLYFQNRNVFSKANADSSFEFTDKIRLTTQMLINWDAEHLNG